MTINLDRGFRTARKTHECFHCCRDIVPGTKYGFQTNKYDYVYTISWHLDCAALHGETCDGDWDDEGYPGLREMWCDDGEYYTMLEAYRGLYPHVIARLELTDQLRGVSR